MHYFIVYHYVSLYSSYNEAHFYEIKSVYIQKEDVLSEHPLFIYLQAFLMPLKFHRLF